ncbi:MAG: methyltransferase domain-containing protein [Pseudomonadales bacterium]|nr:methyltransferase domain-containing protein [Pseudomonadales bacterium]
MSEWNQGAIKQEQAGEERSATARSIRSRTENFVDHFFEKKRAWRVRQFVEQLQPGPDDLVLDLGSEDGSYLAAYYPYPQNIVLADIREGNMAENVRRFGLAGYRMIPASGALPFADGEFSFLWCNSVIEHVTVASNLRHTMTHAGFVQEACRHQRLFAEEIKRIADAYFVQTPNIHYPVESHSVLPLVQYLEMPARERISRWTSRWWLTDWEADFLLFDMQRLAMCFDDADELIEEKTFGITKSLIALRRRRQGMG